MRGIQVRVYLVELARSEEKELYAILVQLQVHRVPVLRKLFLD